MANELDGIKRLLRASPEDPNIVQEQDWDEFLNATQGALDQKVPAASPKFQTRVDIAAASFSASFRDDGAGNLGWYVGAVGAVDGAQLKAATVDKTNGYLGLGTSSPGVRLHLIGSQKTEVASGGTALEIVNTSVSKSWALFPETAGSDSSLSFYSTSGTPARRLVLEGQGVVRPGADNTQTLGAASFRWSVVYAGTGTINTSDAREKIAPDGEDLTEAAGWSVTPPTEAELRVSRRLAGALGWFKFKDAVAAKGLEGARKHFGLTVQFGLQVCTDEGVDPWALGIFCRDEVTRRVKVMQTVTEQQAEPTAPVLDIEIIDGVPTQVLREQPDCPLFEMKPVIGIDGEPVMIEDRPLLHPVPVMIEVEREVEIDEPAGERLGFRPDQLALFMLAGIVGS